MQRSWTHEHTFAAHENKSQIHCVDYTLGGQGPHYGIALYRHHTDQQSIEEKQLSYTKVLWTRILVRNKSLPDLIATACMVESGIFQM